jgi:ABC-type phosphate transport system substrate-binding protein
MHARKLLTGLATSAVALSVLALTAGPAAAVYTADPDDTTYNPGADADLIGVGSDTTQGVVRALANAYNLTSPAAKIVSWSATAGTTGGVPNPPGTVPMPSGSEINRPVGSGAGKNLLHAPSNDPRIDFARSSSAQSAGETADGLQSFPFAVDTLIMVKSGSGSHAPATLTVQQILGIYQHTITDWATVGGTAGTIKAMLPQSGSGTLSFFTAQLTAANGGVAPTYSGTTTVTEHDPTLIMNDPDAIAPFSLAKKSTLANPAVVTTEPGFQADRAVYNVVRGGDVAKPEVLAAFGTNGYFCSAAGKTVIEAQGFRQLFPPSKGGVCGQPTQNPTTNLITANVTTTTTVTVTSASASSARITAAVTGSSPPSGTVAFFEGATQLASGVPLTSGQGVRVQTTTPGAHTYRAVFTPAANTPFTSSEGTGTGTVQKATSSIKADFPKTVKFGKKAKGTVTVTLNGSSSKATGTVTIKEGSKVVGTGTLSNGKVTITLKKKLKPGKHKLTVSWAGDANGSGSEAKIKIKGLAKPKS